MILSREDQLNLTEAINKRLVIKTSTLKNAGQGLFTTQPIAQKAIVAFYTGTECTVPQPNDFDFRKKATYAMHERHAYMQNLMDSNYLVGFQEGPPGFLAQKANDPCITAKDIAFLQDVKEDSFDQNYLDRLSEIFKNYTSCTMKFNNVLLQRDTPLSKSLPYPFFVSARPIKANEEIFYSYGARYWSGIVYENCMRRGLVLQSIFVKRAVAKGVEKALHEALIREKKLPESITYGTFRRYLGHSSEKLTPTLPIENDILKHYEIFQSAHRDCLQQVYLYSPQSSFLENFEFFLNFLPMMQIPGLFFPKQTLLLEIRKPDIFFTILEKINFDKRIKKIAQLEPTAFLQHKDHYNSPAQESLQLLADLFHAAKLLKAENSFQFFMPETINAALSFKNQSKKQHVSPALLKEVLNLPEASLESL